MSQRKQRRRMGTLKELLKKVKRVTGIKFTADLARVMFCTRQYVSQLINNPAMKNDLRLLNGVEIYISSLIDEETRIYEARMNVLRDLRSEVNDEINKIEKREDIA
jgi:hypothetical protein